MNEVVIKTLPLDLIIIEQNFRSSDKTKDLIKNIDSTGLQQPIILEGPNEDGRYYLISGYRRYVSLKQLGFKEVQCSINPPTSKGERMLYILNNALHTKKLTGFELEKIVKCLQDEGYTEDDLSKVLHIPKYRVKKYASSPHIDQAKKEEAEKAHLGRDGLIRLENLRNIAPFVKDRLWERYRSGEIFGYHIKNVEYATKNNYFGRLPKKLQMTCVEEIIEESKFTKEKANQIVYIKFLQYRYDEALCDLVYKEVCKEAKSLDDHLSPNLLDHLTESKIRDLRELTSSMNKRLDKSIIKQEIAQMVNVKVTRIR